MINIHTNSLDLKIYTPLMYLYNTILDQQITVHDSNPHQLVLIPSPERRSGPFCQMGFGKCPKPSLRNCDRIASVDDKP